MMHFLRDALLVLALVLAIVGALLLCRVGPRNLLAYFKTRDGRGVLRGIILAPAVLFAAAAALFVIGLLIGNKAYAQDSLPGGWFKDASVFMGIDRTRHLSPQCYAGDYDDRSTSNMGIRLNVWESPSGNVRINSKYTHHSCALNRDRNSYDALGLEVEWILWRR